MAGKARVFSREFKEAAVVRILAGERVQALAEELQIWPKLLYDWWNHYERGGPAALRPTGRPPRGATPGGEVTARGDDGPTRAPAAPRRRRSRRGRPRRPVAEPATTQRIAELERKVGEQALELDFFARALRHVKAPPPPSGGRGAAASARSSTR